MYPGSKSTGSAHKNLVDRDADLRAGRMSKYSSNQRVPFESVCTKVEALMLRVCFRTCLHNPLLSYTPLKYYDIMVFGP